MEIRSFARPFATTADAIGTARLLLAQALPGHGTRRCIAPKSISVLTWCRSPSSTTPASSRSTMTRRKMLPEGVADE
jgi:hypothetical protein